jgi:hypothetical protein
MANQTKSADTSFDEATEKLVSYNEKVVETSKKLTGTAIDAYEKAALGVADLHEKVAGASNVEWVTSVASTQAGLTRDLTKAYTSAARELIK